MKNLFKLLPFALLALGLTACDNNDDPEYTLRVLTFEDRDYKGTDNGGKGFADWSSLIDTKEYDGALLYPKDEGGTWIYNWNDADNTFLASELADSRGDRQFWGGGHAVSNYVETDIAQCDYTRQLSVCFESNGGHNGSKNFCIHNGANDNVAKQPSFRFMDGKERVVDHMWVVNTSYALNNIKNGDWSVRPRKLCDRAPANSTWPKTPTLLPTGPGGTFRRWARWPGSPSRWRVRARANGGSIRQLISPMTTWLSVLNSAWLP